MESKKPNMSKEKEHHYYRKIIKPWGFYKTIGIGDTWQVKEIFVNPKSSLSLQSHKFRSEYWIIIKGIANVEINEQKMILKEGHSTHIPVGALHRLSNFGDVPLIIIEVQSGSYLGEDDIVRYKDNYGRCE